MFETFFSYPAVLRRYQDGPLAGEREPYVKDLAIQRTARLTLLKRALYCLCVAHRSLGAHVELCCDDSSESSRLRRFAPRSPHN